MFSAIFGGYDDPKCGRPTCDKFVQEYKHQPLSDPSTSIRVFNLKAGRGRQPLCGTITTQQLKLGSSKSPYEALSYRWDDIPAHRHARHVDHLHINGCILPISPSLGEALYLFRAANKDRRLWIDQVCIIQDKTNPEKEHQIPIMGEVYAEASATLIWLGTVDPKRSELEGLDFIQSFRSFRIQLEAAAEKQGRAKTNSLSMTKRELKTSLMFALGNEDSSTLEKMGVTAARSCPAMTRSSASHIVDFYRKEWFIRGWVMQEIVRSGKKTMFLGEHEIEWEDVGWFSAYFCHKYKDVDLGVTKYNFKGIEAAMWVYFYSCNYVDGYPFLEMLRATRKRITGFPEDRVKVLFGIVNFDKKLAGGRYGDNRLSKVGQLPDELKPPPLNGPPLQDRFWDTYFDAARYLIKKDGSVQVLALRQFVDEGEDLPKNSWIPRWDCTEEHTPIWLPITNTGPGWNFSAYASQDSQIQCRQSDRYKDLFTCTVRGVKLGPVTCILSALFPTDADDWDWSLVAQMIAKAAKEFGRGWSPHWDKDLKLLELPIELSLLLTAGRRNLQVLNITPQDLQTTYDLKDSPKAQHLSCFIALARDLFSSYQHLFTELQKEAYIEFLLVCIKGKFAKFLPMADDIAEPRTTKYAESCKNSLRGRKVVATDRWLGLAPACVKAYSDDVWFLRGAKIPFLLRPVASETSEREIGGTHKLSGEFYGGLGLMFGEMSGSEEMVVLV